MHDLDAAYEMMMEGRLNLMHLPAGAVAWLWDRPAKQVDAAEALAVAANAYGNPVTDASLLRADQNILLIKCEGGECFRVYPDGGYSCDGVPMDMGGCSAVLQGSMDSGCPMDELGHAVGGAPKEDMGNDEHMDDAPPEAGEALPRGLTNLAGEPTQEDIGGDWGGPGTTDGMGTGSPYVGMMFLSDEDEHESEFNGEEFDRKCRREYSDEDLEDLAKALGIG